jgi:hypothetical protein
LSVCYGVANTDGDVFLFVVKGEERIYGCPRVFDTTRWSAVGRVKPEEVVSWNVRGLALHSGPIRREIIRIGHPRHDTVPEDRLPVDAKPRRAGGWNLGDSGVIREDNDKRWTRRYMAGHAFQASTCGCSRISHFEGRGDRIFPYLITRFFI